MSTRETFACIDCGKRVLRARNGTTRWCIRCLFDLSPDEMRRYRGSVNILLGGAA